MGYGTELVLMGNVPINVLIYVVVSGEQMGLSLEHLK